MKHHVRRFFISITPSLQHSLTPLFLLSLTPILQHSTTAFFEPPLVFPVEGEPFRATVSRVDQNCNITFETGSARRVFAAEDIVSWGAQVDNEKGPQVVMADGGLLIVETLQIRGEHLEFETRYFGPSRLPLKFVRGVVFQPPADILVRDRLLHRVATADGQEDQLLLANGDALRGSLISGPDDASAPDPFAAPLRLETGTRQIEVPRDRLTAVIFNPALVTVPKPQQTTLRIGLRDGTSLFAESVMPKQDRLQLILPGAIKLETYPGLDPAEFFSDLTLLQTQSGRVTYLSDLQSIGYKHIPYLSIEWPYGVDQNVMGGRLRWNDRIYAKGIGMHSTSRLAYDLNGRYRWFAAELALDRQAGNSGSVEYRVYLQSADGSWNNAYSSTMIRGGDDPVHVKVKIAGASRMALIVDWADRADVLDHANWINARLIE